jgi:hypothetical protein
MKVAGVYGDVVRNIPKNDPHQQPGLYRSEVTCIFGMICPRNTEPDEEFPSWVPRWNKMNTFQFHLNWNTSKDTTGTVAEGDGKTCLVVKGMQISTIRIVHELPIDYEGLEAL